MFTKKKLVISMLAAAPLLGIAADETDQENVQLDAMIITATMEETKIEDAPAFSTIVTKDDIAKSAVNSVADLLRETVGVNNLSDSSGRDEIQIRGLDGDYTLFLVNGKRVSTGSAFAKGSDADLNSVALNAIERIEIIRGPMSVLYGADAIGGVVNVITKTPQVDDGWTSTINTEARIIDSGEGGDQYRLGVSSMGAITDKLSLSVSVEGLSQDAWFADADDTSSLKEEKNAQNVSSTLSWQAAENQQVDLDFGYNHDDRPYQAYSDTAYREQELTRLDLAVTHKGQWDWADTTAYIKREESDIYDYNTQYEVEEHDGIESNNTTAKAYANKVLGMHALMSGVDFDVEELKDDSSLVDGAVSSYQYGFFAQDEMALTEKLAFTLGGRLDTHEVYGSNFSPKGYLVYGVNEALTLKGGVSSAFKAPSLSQYSEDYYQTSCGGDCVLYGNSDLEAETSVSYEFGFDYHKKGLNVTGALFRNDIDNMITTETSTDDDGDTTKEWINIEKAMTQGLELTADFSLTEDLQLKSNYTYLDTEAEDSDGVTAVLEGRPEHQASLSLDYQATDMLSTYVTVNYIAGMQYESDDDVYETLASYYRTDIGIVADITDDLVIRAGIKNIGDVRIDEEDTNYTTYEIGRSFFASAAYSF